jgi:hypothetical protein
MNGLYQFYEILFIKKIILLQKIVVPTLHFQVNNDLCIKVEHEGFKRRNPLEAYTPGPHATFSIVLYGQVVVHGMYVRIGLHACRLCRPPIAQEFVAL